MEWTSHAKLFQTMLVLCSSEIVFSFLIKMLTLFKAMEIETEFFIPLGVTSVARWII